LPADLEGCFGGEVIQVFALTQTRVRAIGALDEAIRRLAYADTSTPSRFRGLRS
jgi:aminoglycoside N3'-acetyltransferase